MNDKQIIGGKKGCVIINGRSRMVVNQRLLNLSFNTTLDVTKQLELSRKKNTNAFKIMLTRKLD